MRLAILLCGLIWQAAVVLQPVQAEESLGGAIDCTDVSVDYTDDPSLTREERLRLMDKAFFDSLNRFELCQAAKQRAAAAAGGGTAGSGDRGGAAGNGGNSGDEPGGLTNDAGVGSVASPTMSGTEPPPELTSAGDMPARQEAASQDVQDMAAEDTAMRTGMSRGSGKLPEDIPPAANDDALAAQIRYAAENEPDPVKAGQLWNEYRKYKGMAPKN